jgi:glucose/arabinose dehydrogenase
MPRPLQMLWLLVLPLLSNCGLFEANAPSSAEPTRPGSALPTAELALAPTMPINPGFATPMDAFFTPTPVLLSALEAVTTEFVADGFTLPVAITHANDDSGRIFVVEKRGTIAILRDGQRQEQIFLDITEKVGSSSSEQGLLGLAFHPNYRENGLFFVNYTDRDGNTLIERYRVSDDPERADPESGLRLLGIEQPASNHNGGALAFGPDGMLYIGTGDGGRGGDPWGNAQNTEVLLGKMLRLDVDSAEPYAIPADNPFASGEGGLAEIWAWGLRNPWRFSFDRLDGQLFIADVGQSAYEEINAAPFTSAGLNYGWNITEGEVCYGASSCDREGLTDPVYTYGRDQGQSVTGGYVYRGSAYPRMQGYFIFGDYASGRIWALGRSDQGSWFAREVLASGLQISSFGEDQQGELYVADLGDGAIYRIVAE